MRGRPLLWGAVLMFAALTTVYLGSIDIRATRGASITGDEPFYLLTSQSLVDDGDFDLTNQYEQRSYESFFDHRDPLWRQSVPNEDGVLLSPHNPGLSFLVLPGFAIGGLLGVQVQLVLLAALTFALTYVLVSRLSGRPGLAWVATAAVALTATSFIYASEVYPEMPAALFLVAALLIAVRSRGALAAIGVGLCLTAMVWLGLKYAPLVLFVAAMFAWRGTWAGRGALAAVGLPGAALFAWFHIELFGALTPYSVGTVHAGFSDGEVLESHFALDQAYRLYGIFIDRRFGIGRWAPVLFVAVVSVPLLLRRSPHRPWSATVLALLLAQLGMATFVAITMMGWWFAGRTMMTVLPLFALPIALGLAAFPRGLGVPFAVLAVYSLSITVALALAGHSREVVIAVAPFDMGAWNFRAVSELFPQYTSWSTHTRWATVGWLAAAGVALAGLYGQGARSRVAGAFEAVRAVVAAQLPRQ